MAGSVTLRFSPRHAAPSGPNPPPMVTPGILGRFRELAREIKVATPYTDAMGTALGIVGHETTAPDPATLVPEIALLLNGGKVDVLWTKNGQEALEIQVVRGTGIWQFLAVDTRPNYIDTTPAPSPAAKWKYRAIYTADSQRLGQWSDIAEITVGADVEMME